MKLELHTYSTLLAKMLKTYMKPSHFRKMAERILLKSFIEAFESRCVSETNVINKCYMFNRQTQEPGESIDHYITDVIKLAENCQYGCLRDDLIRDKLIVESETTK